MKLQMNAPVDDNGNIQEVAPKVVASGGRFTLLPQGFYTAVVTKLTEEEYYGKKDPKQPYIKVIPEVKIIVGERGQDNVWRETKRIPLIPQDLTVGAVRGGQLVRLQGDGKNPLFGGLTGARQFLTNAGLARLNGDKVELDFDATIILNRMFKVFVGLAAYIPAVKADPENGIVEAPSQNWDADEFKDWLKEATGLRTDEEIKALKFDDIVVLADNAGMRLKNVVTFWGAFSQEEAERRGYHFDAASGAVFESVDDFTTYRGLLALPKSNGASNDGW